MRRADTGSEHLRELSHHPRAVLTAFLFPVLLADAGIDFLLSVLIATSLLGAWITWQFRIETTGVSLEKIGR